LHGCTKGVFGGGGFLRGRHRARVVSGLRRSI
jgi:hypothetical protein